MDFRHRHRFAFFGVLKNRSIKPNRSIPIPDKLTEMLCDGASCIREERLGIPITRSVLVDAFAVKMLTDCHAKQHQHADAQPAK